MTAGRRILVTGESGAFGQGGLMDDPRVVEPLLGLGRHIALPLSVSKARGSFRFWIACARPCPSVSAVSARYP